MDKDSNKHWAVDINNGYKTITINHGTTLLTGLARNGILLPSACGGNARCGACKIKVTSDAGKITPNEEPILSIDEKNDFFRLACQLRVENDLKVEVPPDVFTTRQFSGKLIKKQFLTHDIVGLRIELVKPQSIEFVAGQYVQIRSQPYLGREAVVRAYSIASLPSDSRFIELIVRKVPNGICTGWIFDIAKEGDKVYFTGPYGQFRLTDSSAPAIFIGGGSGMAPFWSMLHDMREKGIRRKIIFFFGALTLRDLFLLDELRELQKALPGFSFIPALSSEKENSEWKGECGLITEVVARLMPNCSDYEAYLCGSPGMLEACIKVLTQGGIQKSKIFYDKF
jgi:Na+-transporting NADH:ubiquinone oxidoreductase subunit F